MSNNSYTEGKGFILITINCYLNSIQKTVQHVNIDSVRLHAFDLCCSNNGPSPGSIPGTGHGIMRVEGTTDFILTLLLLLPFGFPSATCGEEEEEYE